MVGGPPLLLSLPPSVPTSPCISRSKRKEIQWAQWLSEGSAQGFCEGFLQNTENVIAHRLRQRVNAWTLCRATIGVGSIVFVSPSSYKAIMSTMWTSTEIYTSWQNRWGIICCPFRWLSEINLYSEFKFCPHIDCSFCFRVASPLQIEFNVHILTVV